MMIVVEMPERTIILDEALFPFSDQLVAKFRPELQAIWLHWSPQPRPCFNLALLDDLESYWNFFNQNNGRIHHNGQVFSVEYSILKSDTPDVFNLGGDLNSIRQWIGEQDHASLLHYGISGIKAVYRNYQAYGLPLTTVSLIQGLCLGGGFEAALSSDVLVAERRSRFGFPEISFNLFPGMGAYSLLMRRVGRRSANDLLTSGKRYTAQELFDLGVIDVLAEDGEGDAVVVEWLKNRKRNLNGHRGISIVRRLVEQIEYNELLAVVKVWADCALCLNNRDLKLMQRLIDKQNNFD